MPTGSWRWLPFSFLFHYYGGWSGNLKWDDIQAVDSYLASSTAGTLANQPQLILADEPTGKLDTTTVREIFTLFREIVEGEGATILMAAHDPLVDEFVDGVLQLSDGQIMERENPPS